MLLGAALSHSSIGYGTFAPETAGGKAFVSMFCLLGMGYFGYTLTIVCDRFLTFVKHVTKSRQEAKERKEDGLIHKMTDAEYKKLQFETLIGISVIYVFVLSAAGPARR